jgi:hypothetical protein
MDCVLVKAALKNLIFLHGMIKMQSYSCRHSCLIWITYHKTVANAGTWMSPLFLWATNIIPTIAGLENREYGRRDPSLNAKFGTCFSDKWRLLGRHSSLADSGHRVFFNPSNRRFNIFRLKILFLNNCLSKFPLVHSTGPNRGTGQCFPVRLAENCLKGLGETKQASLWQLGITLQPSLDIPNVQINWRWDSIYM